MKINEQIKETYEFMKICENPRISKKIIESQLLPMKNNESQRTDFTAGRSSREPSTCIDNRYIETYELGIIFFILESEEIKENQYKTTKIKGNL